MSDGTRLELNLYATAYARLCENSSGLLYYKERNGETWFLGFDPIDDGEIFHVEQRYDKWSMGLFDPINVKKSELTPKQPLPPYSKVYYENLYKNANETQLSSHPLPNHTVSAQNNVNSNETKVKKSWWFVILFRVKTRIG